MSVSSSRACTTPGRVYNTQGAFRDHIDRVRALIECGVSIKALLSSIPKSYAHLTPGYMPISQETYKKPHIETRRKSSLHSNPIYPKPHARRNHPKYLQRHAPPRSHPTSTSLGTTTSYSHSSAYSPASPLSCQYHRPHTSPDPHPYTRSPSSHCSSSYSFVVSVASVPQSPQPHPRYPQYHSPAPPSAAAAPYSCSFSPRQQPSPASAPQPEPPPPPQSPSRADYYSSDAICDHVNVCAPADGYAMSGL